MGFSIRNGIYIGGGGSAPSGGGGGGSITSPADLFGSGDWGGYWDFTDTSTLWRNQAATIPATVGGEVERADDLSGLGNHLTTYYKGPDLWVSGDGTVTGVVHNNGGTGYTTVDSLRLDPIVPTLETDGRGYTIAYWMSGNITLAYRCMAIVSDITTSNTAKYHSVRMTTPADATAPATNGPFGNYTTSLYTTDSPEQEVIGTVSTVSGDGSVRKFYDHTGTVVTIPSTPISTLMKYFGIGGLVRGSNSASWRGYGGVSVGLMFIDRELSEEEVTSLIEWGNSHYPTTTPP